MDAAAGAIVFDTARNVLGDVILDMFQNAQKGKYTNYQNDKEVFDKLFQIAYQKGQNKVDELYDQLNRIGLVRTSPAIENALHKMASKYRAKISALRDDMASLQAAKDQMDLEADRTEDYWNRGDTDFQKQRSKFYRRG